MCAGRAPTTTGCAAPFTRLPSLVKDPEHPNVLYNRTPVRSRVTKRPRLHRAAQSKPSGETEGHPIKNLHRTEWSSQLQQAQETVAGWDMGAGANLTLFRKITLK